MSDGALGQVEGGRRSPGWWHPVASCSSTSCSRRVSPAGLASVERRGPRDARAPARRALAAEGPGRGARARACAGSPEPRARRDRHRGAPPAQPRRAPRARARPGRPAPIARQLAARRLAGAPSGGSSSTPWRARPQRQLAAGAGKASRSPATTRAARRCSSAAARSPRSHAASTSAQPDQAVARVLGSGVAGPPMPARAVESASGSPRRAAISPSIARASGNSACQMPILRVTAAASASSQRPRSSRLRGPDSRRGRGRGSARPTPRRTAAPPRRLGPPSRARAAPRRPRRG